MRRQKAEQQDPWPMAATSTPEALDKLTEEVRVLAKRIGALQQQLETLCAELRDRPSVEKVTVRDLNSDKYTLKSPIEILVEEDDEEAVASWPELEVFASGASVSEALALLKQEIVSLYEDLKRADKATLGKLPTSWLRILSRLIRPSRAPARV